MDALDLHPAINRHESYRASLLCLSDLQDAGLYTHMRTLDIQFSTARSEAKSPSI